MLRPSLSGSTPPQAIWRWSTPGTNPAFMLCPDDETLPPDEGERGTPLGMLPGGALLSRTHRARAGLEPAALHRRPDRGLSRRRRVLEKNGCSRPFSRGASTRARQRSSKRAEAALESLWTTLDTFTGGAPQQDDMSAIALCPSFRASPIFPVNSGFSVVSKENA